nr:unnamed protein product [Digitaria exilis]
MASSVPEVALRSCNARPMPALGMGTAAIPPVPEAAKNAVLAAIEVGYRHFDTAEAYATEKPLGEAVAEALRRRLVASREELFVTSKLWCTKCHPDLVAGPPSFPARKEDAMPFDFEGVWRGMEECQRLGLAKAIGVSNFTTRHLHKVMAVATIPPAVNQVELNPVWQQQKLRDYCAEKGIHVAAFSPLGGQNWDGGQGNAVLGSEVLAEIAKARGKTIAQV